MQITKTFNSVNFVPDVKKNLKPGILDSYIDDEGDKMLVLDNGRECKETIYNAMWLPVKGKIDWKAKGENPDRRKLLI